MKLTEIYFPELESWWNDIDEALDELKEKKSGNTLSFEEMLKDKYIRINDNLFQNRNYHYRKTKKELLEMYNAIGQLL